MAFYIRSGFFHKKCGPFFFKAIKDKKDESPKIAVLKYLRIFFLFNPLFPIFLLLLKRNFYYLLLREYLKNDAALYKGMFLYKVHKTMFKQKPVF